MLPILAASAAQNGGVYLKILSELVNLCSGSHRVKDIIVINDFLAAVTCFITLRLTHQGGQHCGNFYSYKQDLYPHN
jgi:hypothetical protein